MYAVIDSIGTDFFALLIPILFLYFIYRHERKFPFYKKALVFAIIISVIGSFANWNDLIGMAASFIFLLPLVYWIIEKATRKKRGVQTIY